MRIAYVLDEPVPSSETSTEQAINTIAGIARAGGDVTLFLPRNLVGTPPSIDEIRDYYGVSAPFRVARLRSAFPSKRPLEKLGHAVRAALHRQLRAFELVYTRNIATMLTMLPAGHRVAYETYRPWPTQYPVLAPLFRAAMGHRRFVRAFVHSEYARESFVAAGIAADRIEVLHNGFEPARLEPALSRREARAQLGLPLDAPTITYTGRVTMAKGLGIALEMARRLPRAQFVLVGSEGQGEVELAAKNLPNVHVFGWQSAGALAPFLYAADILLLPPTLAPMQSNTVLPMKLYLYLAAGRTIFGPDAPDTAELLHHDDNACLTVADEVETAIADLDRLLGDPARMERLARRSAEMARQFTWEARGRRLLASVSEDLLKTQADAARPPGARPL